MKEVIVWPEEKETVPIRNNMHYLFPPKVASKMLCSLIIFSFSIDVQINRLILIKKF